MPKKQIGNYEYGEFNGAFVNRGVQLHNIIMHIISYKIQAMEYN